MRLSTQFQVPPFKRDCLRNFKYPPCKETVYAISSTPSLKETVYAISSTPFKRGCLRNFKYSPHPVKRLSTLLYPLKRLSTQFQRTPPPSHQRNLNLCANINDGDNLVFLTKNWYYLTCRFMYGYKDGNYQNSTLFKLKTNGIFFIVDTIYRFIPYTGLYHIQV